MTGNTFNVPGQLEEKLQPTLLAEIQNLQQMLHHLHFKLNKISLVKVTVNRTDLNCARSKYGKSETVILIKPEWGHQKPLLLTILSSQHTNLDLSV